MQNASIISGVTRSKAAENSPAETRSPTSLAAAGSMP